MEADLDVGLARIHVHQVVHWYSTGHSDPADPHAVDVQLLPKCIAANEKEKAEEEEVDGDEGSLSDVVTSDAALD
eukprot:12907919-Prorocentrum_lima.AAC.1